MTVTQRDSLASQDSKLAASVSASAWGFSLDGSYSQGSSTAASTNARNSFSKTSISNIGGIAPLGNSPSDMVSWILTAESRPMPTSYELGEIWELLEGSKQEAMKACLAALSKVPSIEYNLTGEAKSMRFGTLMPDGQPANAFASSPQAALRFKSERRPIEGRTGDFDTRVDFRSPLPGAVYVAQALLMSPFVNDIILPLTWEDGGIYVQPYQRAGLPSGLDRYLRQYQGLYANLACRPYVSQDPLRAQRISLYSSCMLLST